MITATRVDSMLDAADRVLVLTCAFGAPRDLVFRAGSDPEKMRRRAGPHDRKRSTQPASRASDARVTSSRALGYPARV